MVGLTRRTLLSGATLGAAAALSGMPRIAEAAAPPAGKQAPGFYRYKVGDIEVTVVADGARTFPFDDKFVTNASRDDINRSLEASFMPKDHVFGTFNPIAFVTGGKLVVVDTGNGETAFNNTKGALGQFTNNLKAAGFDRDKVDVVVISHFHGDHVNGLLTADGKPAFPNAEVMVPAAEWKYWMDDGEMSRAPTGRMADLFKNNRRVFDGVGRKVTPYEWGKEAVRGLTAVEAVGHTPGHTAFVLASGNDKVFVQSDTTWHPALNVRNPGWHLAYDQDGVRAEQTRRRVYDMVVAEKMAVQAFHYPFPSLAHVEKDGAGYRPIPAQWNPVM